MTNKLCRKCGSFKSLEEYHNNERSNDGKFTTCKECIKIYNKKYFKDTYVSNGRPVGRPKKLK